MVNTMEFNLFQILLLILFYIFISLLQGYSLYIFLCIFFQRKITLIKMFFIIFGTLLLKSLVGSYLSSIGIIIFSVLMYFIVSVKGFYGDYPQKIFVSIYYTVFVLCTELLITFLFGFVSNFVEPFIIYSVQMLFVITITLLIVKRLYVFKNDSYITLTSREWLTLTVISMCSLAILLVNLYKKDKDIASINEYMNIQFVIMVVCLLVMNIAILFLYQKLLEFTNNKLKTQLIEKQILEYEKRFQNQKKIHYLRHDIKNILVTIRGFIMSKSTTKAENYINTIIESHAMSNESITGHIVIDAICSEKIEEAKKRGVSIIKNIVIPYDMPLEGKELELSLILGNVLDNALEEVVTLKNQTERWIEIEMRYYNNNLIIRVMNPTKKIKELFYSSEKNALNARGNGINIIKMFVEKLNGTVTFDQSNQVFKVVILLNME